jgi:hypothetical protein
MKKFAKKIFFLFIPFCLLFFIGILYMNSYLRNDSFYKLNSNIKTIILGNSHTECSLNDSLISDSKNFSQSAESYFYTYYKLYKLSEANPQIKTVILSYSNVDCNMQTVCFLTYGESSVGYRYPKYSHLISIKDNFYLFNKNPGAFLIASKDAFKEKIKFLLTKNNNFYEQLSWGHYEYLKKHTTEKLEKTKTAEFMENIDNENFDTNKYNIDYNNIDYLNKIIDYCLSKKIRLILLRSPLNKLYTKPYEIQFLYNANQCKTKIEFWDYVNYNISDNGFADYIHLNYMGATQFSKLINQRLKEDF